MIQILQGLDRLTKDLTELQCSLMSNPIDAVPYLKQLDRAVETLEAKCNRVAPPKAPLDPEEVWARFRMLSFGFEELDARELRTLCVSPLTAMRPKLVNALSENPKPLHRWMNLNGFVQAYFGQWRTMENPDSVETLIRQTLSRGTKARGSKFLDLWRNSTFLFSAEASTGVGKVILKQRTSVKQTCEAYCIHPSSPLAAEAQVSAAVAAVDELVHRDVRIGPEIALKELQWIAEHLLTSGLSPAAYRKAMSALIVSKIADSVPPFRAAIVDLVHADERLGDPRLAYCAPNWRAIPEARERFLAWLAKETLQFFFDTLVPRNDTNRRRAEFWLEYAKKQGKIKDFQVAVSEEDRFKILASRVKTIPSYSTVTGGKTSAFLMIFEGYGTEYVVIEFSEAGNAAYVYQRKVFEEPGITIRSKVFHLSDDLKRVADAEHRIWHRINTNERWEVKARRQLAELGVRP